MQDLNIIDNYIDDREFRNYVTSILTSKGFTNIRFDDIRLSDTDTDNDNDILADLKGKTYTIHTFLNKDITTKEVDEVVQDVEEERVGYGILVTNTVVSEEVKQYGVENGIDIWDRGMFQ